MKRILARALIAVTAFTVGIASTAVWHRRPSSFSTARPSNDCVPRYDESILDGNLREIDDPLLFSAFQELPLYAMPACVDEAYSLTWIPSFHTPVVVRVWRSRDQAFMVAKQLDISGWATLGKVKEVNSRPLTDFEWRAFKDLINQNSYWELSSTTKEIDLQDGAVWLLDGLRSKQFHWVRRRIPDQEYGEICKHLIRLSGLETSHNLYLP